MRTRRSLRPHLVLGFITALLVSLLPATAPTTEAWGNNGDRFGTHDWVLYQAVEALGGAPEWLDLDVALVHTDDPDVEPTSDPFLVRGHVYKEKGRRGGGPSAVVESYVRAVEAHQAGDWSEASRQVGILAHYLGDLAQPYHSAYAAQSDKTLHRAYEQLVAPYTNHPDDWSQWRVQTVVTPSTDVRRTTVGTAAYSRPFYPELRRHLVDHPGELDARAREITGLVLRRASQDLASIIAAVPGGVGLGPQLNVSVTIRAHRLPATAGALISMRVTDPDGKGVEGVMFVARIPDPKGRSHLEHWTTDANGDAHFYFKVKGLTKGIRYTVNVRARIGADTVTWPQWFKVTR